jgi:hypothetical protein
MVFLDFIIADRFRRILIEEKSNILMVNKRTKRDKKRFVKKKKI